MLRNDKQYFAVAKMLKEQKLSTIVKIAEVLESLVESRLSKRSVGNVVSNESAPNTVLVKDAKLTYQTGGIQFK